MKIDFKLVNMQKSLFFVIFFLFLHCSQKQISAIDINFDHLFKLTETVTINGKECDIIHIYSEYPDYNWVDASSEGIACVDDAARAVVLYLRYYELSKDKSILLRAIKLLNFITYMQADDGEFYNFIDKNLQINTTGETSKKNFGFWAARAYWSIGYGYRIYYELDPEYARHLKAAFQKCKQPIEKLLQNYGRYETISGRQYPQWLIHKTGSDAAAELILGLAEFLKCEYDQQLADYSSKLAEGIIAMQIDDGSNLHGAFLSWPNLWHAWGNAQTQALTSIGMVLDSPRFIQAAQKEADNYYSYLLSDGMKNSWWTSKADTIEEFPQIAYGVRCITVGLLRLYEATAEIKYAEMAGEAASWLVGNNAAEQVMYDSKTGRCLDGINNKSMVNLNSGAESTIEALLTLVEIKLSGLVLQGDHIVFY